MNVDIFKEVSHRIKWAKRIKKDKGLATAIKLIQEGIILKRKFFILIYELNNNLKEPNIPESILIIEGDFEKLNYYRKIMKRLPSEFFFDEIDGAEKFFMVLIKENDTYNPAAICWIYTNKQINRVIKLKNDEVEMKHGITLDKYRNIGIFSILVDYMMFNLKKAGIRRVVNLIEIKNSPSIKIFKRYGFKIVAEKTFRKYLGLRISTLYNTYS